MKQRKGHEQLERGVTNREASEDLQRGGLKQPERGNKSLSGRSRDQDPLAQGDIHGHPKHKGIPENIEEIEAENVADGGAGGRSRSARVMNPNRKRKRAA